MNKPELLGCEVITPDGRGSILSLHNKRVHVRLHSVGMNQKMYGSPIMGPLNLAYKYEDVEIIKGQYCFNDSRMGFQYPEILAKAPKQDQNA